MSPEEFETLIRRVVREELDRRLPPMPAGDSGLNEETDLIEQDGLLVARGEAVQDLAQFVQDERGRRLATLLTKASQ